MKHTKSALHDNAKEGLKEGSQVETPFGVDYPKFLTVLLPEKLDLEKLIRENPPENIPAFHVDNIKYILNLISYLPSTKKDYSYENFGYVPINKQKLQRSGIYHYRKYIDYLVDCGVIYEGEYYIVGEMSKGISFSYEYSYCKLKKDKIIKKTLIKAIIKNSIKRNNAITEEQLPYLAKWWNSQDLDIDYDAAIQFLNNRFDNSKKELMQKFNFNSEEELFSLLEAETLKKRREKKLKNPYEQYNSALHVVERLYRKEYLMKIDTTAGRLHTLLTQLPKGLRQFMTFQGQKLVNTDLVNSQPLLAVSLLNKDLLQDHPIILNIIIKYNLKYQTKSHPTMLVDFISKVQHYPSVVKYVEIVSKGVYYEEFGEILRAHGLIPPDVKDVRKFSKEATYSSFFAPNFDIWFIEAMQHFKKVFPSVYKIFSKVKFREKGTKKKEKVHRALSVCLQAFEADLFLNRICKRISEVNPEIPIFTIHDSVVTTLEHQKVVEEIVKDEIFKAIRIVPKLNIEQW